MSAPAGFRINIKSVPTAVHRATTQAQLPRAELERATDHRRDALPTSTQGSCKELYNWSNKEVDQLLDDGRKEGDLKKEVYMVQRIWWTSGRR
jgi:hypothetical protein